MDPNNSQKITISTQNVNGFARNKDFLYSLCDNDPNSIRAIQEHWLKPPFKKYSGTNQLRSIHTNFDGFGTSAMKHSVETKIMKGRPFGGTGFVYNKKYAKCLTPLINYAHDRVTVMKLFTTSVDILLINVYFPYYNTRDLTTHISLYRDTVGFVESVMAQNPNCRYIILADLNCNIYDRSHPYTKIIRDLMTEYDLESCFDSIANFDHNSSFTRSDIKTGSYTLIDGILVSRELRHMISNVRISIYGDNLSDHCPVELDITVQIAEYNLTKNKLQQYINWKKLSDNDISHFREAMEANLSSINVPFHTIIHGDKCCLDDSHKVALEQYYCNIMKAVIEAEAILPKTNPNCERSFWDDELSELKSRSLECTNYWKSVGCPKMGPEFECKKNCHYRYKSELRKKKRSAEKKHNDALFNDL